MHYVCSDIHGQKGYFMQILEMINFGADDTMYVIGDVIDKGPDSISLLQFILEQPNIHMLIGNHEHMMIQGELFDDPGQFSQWIYNKGQKTKEQLDELGEDEKMALLKKLYQLPVVMPDITVGDKRYYLAHACHALKPVKTNVPYRDLTVREIEDIVWSREYKNPEPSRQGKEFGDLYSAYPNTTLIIGHTPVYKCSYGICTSAGYPRISRSCSGHLINLDCGCARGLPLGCLRLEDGKEFYATLPQGQHIVMR